MARASQRVVVIGGGVAGTLAALILSRLPQIGAITVIDRNGAFGRGLAYSARAPWHRINVPASKMGGVGADDPAGFAEWLTANGHATGPAFSDAFVPRWLYGQYLCDQLAPLLASGRVQAVTDRAESITRIGGAYRVAIRDGVSFEADLVFICIGNHPPSPFRGVAPSPRSISNVWAPGALDAIGADDHVLVIGTGATAVDVVIDLTHRGVRGPITMLSRRGLLPRVDVPTVDDPGPRQAWPELTTRGLFNTVRDDIRRYVAAGLPWQTVIDTFRLQTSRFWSALSETERARFSRHLRSIWLAHRHRLAPDVAALLTDMQQSKQLAVIAGRVVTANATAAGHDVVIRRRGGGIATLATDWILNCTGPEERYDRIDDPFVTALLASGHAHPGHNGLGLDVDPTCQLRDAQGYAQPDLYAIGPATRGAFWEVTAASNIRQQLLAVADHLCTKTDASL